MDQKESTKDSGFDALTKRERQLLYPLTEGKANKLIAHELGLSRRTIEAHRANIFRKMGVNNAVQLVSVLYRNPTLSERLTAGDQSNANNQTVTYTQGLRPHRAP